MYRPFQYLLVVVFAIIGGQLFAQFTSNPLDTIQQDTVNHFIDSTDANVMDSLYDARNKSLFDSTKVRYYYMDGRNESMPIDTSLATMESVPSIWDRNKRIQDLPNLSNLGTAKLPLFYTPKLRQGFYMGYETPLLYQLNLERMPLYTVEKNTPFTDIYYSQINQRNTIVKATIGHQITDKLYYSVHYGLVNSMGFYDRQGVRSQNIGILLRYRAGRSESILSFFSNSYTSQESGGLMQDTVANISNKLLAGVPVFLDEASFQSNNTNFKFSQYWYNKSFDAPKEGDSVAASSPATFAWGYDINYEDNLYKYFDESPAGLNSMPYYGLDFGVNAQGLRQYVQHALMSAAGGIRYAFGKGLVQDNSVKPAITPLMLEAQAFYNLHNLKSEPFARTFISNYGVKGILHFNTASDYEDLNYWKGKVAAQALYTENSVDFFVKGDMDFALGKWFNLKANALIQRAEVSQLTRQLYLSHMPIWENTNLKQQQDVSLGATLAIPRLGLSFTANNHTIENLVYSDMNRIMRQATTDQTVNILELSARQDLRLRGFGISGEIAWQKVLAGEEIMPLPELHLKYSVYWEGKVFKSLFLRTGANVHYWTAFNAPGYFPVTQQFYLQTQQNIQVYPRIDYFISFRLYQARVFINAENVMNLFKKENYFTAMNYATPNFLVRFGVSWRMFN